MKDGMIKKLIFFLLLAIMYNPSFIFAQLSEDLSEDEVESYAKDANTEINVKNADISAIIRIFSKKTKRNYILDEKVKGKVSIYLPGKVSADEAINILDSVLSLKGFTAVPIGENLWKIIPAREAKQTTIPTIKEIEGRGNASIVTRLVNLKHVGADEVRSLIAPLISADGLLNAYTGTNSLIIIDQEDNIKRLMDIIETIDIPFTDQELMIIPVTHAEAQDVADKISEILGSNDDSGKDTPVQANNTPNVQRARLSNRNQNNSNNKQIATSSSDAGTVSARIRAPKIIADERTNSIIVVADAEMGNRVRALVSQLDSSVDLSGNRFYVYSCQHANAEDLAEVLAGLVGQGGGQGGGASTSQFSGQNTGSRDRGSRVRNTQNRLSSQSRTPGRSRTENNSGSAGVSSVNLSEDISITADPSTNSLVINAGKSDYEKVRELLKQLDIKRRQVLVEALILEVGVDETTSFSTEFSTSGGGLDGGIYASNTQGGIAGLLSNPTALNNFTLAAASSGVLTLPGGLSIPSQTILMNAAHNNTNANVLSSPNIVATDNEQAEIVVGQNVPFLASTSSNQTNLNNTFNQIDRQDVGITLRITPQISSSDFVTLNLFTEVSNVVPSTAASDLGPTTTVRTSETTVITKNEQMIVIGGLMSDNITEANDGVPFLKDLPIVGTLFRSTTDNQRKTNLLIFITPRIIKDQFDARTVSLEHRDGLQNAMRSGNINPDRHEALENYRLHEVIEVDEYEGEIPKQIKAAKSSNGNENNTTLELRVKPKLPTRNSLEN